MPRPWPRWIITVLLAGATVLGLVGPAPAANTVPLNATFDLTVLGVVPVAPDLILQTITLTSEGAPTPLGATTGTVYQIFDLASGGFMAQFTLVTADGDTVYGVAQGAVDQYGEIVEQFWITGGTGRFAGASGSGSGLGQISPDTIHAAETFAGTISAPRGK
jgi:hypothetical protein